jgi:hypothetical protein
MTKHMIPELQAHVGVPSNCGWGNDSPVSFLGRGRWLEVKVMSWRKKDMWLIGLQDDRVRISSSDCYAWVFQNCMSLL